MIPTSISWLEYFCSYQPKTAEVHLNIGTTLMLFDISLPNSKCPSANHASTLTNKQKRHKMQEGVY